MLIDVHMHLFPNKLAENTLSHLSDICGTKPFTDGTLTGTLDFMDRNHIDRGVALHIATNPRSQTNVNNFALEVQEQTKGRLLSFGSVHPGTPDAIEELRRIKSMGLRGVKLHADYQGFYFNDTRCYPIYEELQSLGLPVTIHAGYDPLSPTDFHAPSRAVAQVAKDFPHLTIVAAHMGGLAISQPEDEAVLGLPNVYFDTAVCATLFQDKKAAFLRYIRTQGPDHVLFGTDCPWEDVPPIQKLLEQIGLTSLELDRIYFGNVMELLGLANL